MGSSVGGNKGFVSEINVTPFVDVMLVLLIIFMVTAPMMTEGLDVDLPQTRAVETLPTESDNMILTVRKDGAIFLDSYEVGLDELQDKINLLVKQQNKQLFLQADKDVAYGLVVDVMGRIREADRQARRGGLAGRYARRPGKEGQEVKPRLSAGRAQRIEGPRLPQPGEKGRPTNVWQLFLFNPPAPRSGAADLPVAELSAREARSAHDADQREHGRSGRQPDGFARARAAGQAHADEGRASARPGGAGGQRRPRSP